MGFIGAIVLALAIQHGPARWRFAIRPPRPAIACESRRAEARIRASDPTWPVPPQEPRDARFSEVSCARGGSVKRRLALPPV